MDEPRKRAYRCLLYDAMLEIRCLAWLQWRTLPLLNPWYCRAEIRRVRRAGFLAHWLHNLAFFSALDFEHFDEDWFWRELDDLNRRTPEYGLGRYRAVFDDWLARFRHDGPGAPIPLGSQGEGRNPWPAQ